MLNILSISKQISKNILKMSFSINSKKLLTIFSIIISLTYSNANLCTASSKEKYLSPVITSKSESTDFMKELTFMATQPLAYWYTDRGSDMNGAKKDLNNFVSKCSGETPVIVVYGIPSKDCDAGESSSGFNQDSSSYSTFINNAKEVLNSAGDAIVILEPDATALTIDGSKCGSGKCYKDNLKKAIEILGESKEKIKMYIDVGHWVVIYGEDKIKDLINFVSEIDPSNKLKGFSLNLSNYRKTGEMENACKKIRDVSGKDYKCIIDTSRNSQGPSDKGTWCNYKNAGIGIGGNDNNAQKNPIIDHFVWIKPAAELDGNCYGNDDSYQSNLGAGAFDINWLKLLWKQGYYSSNDLKDVKNESPNIQPTTSPSTEQVQQPSQSPIDPYPQSDTSPTPAPNQAPNPVPAQQQYSNSEPQPSSNQAPQKSEWVSNIKICKLK